MPREYQTRLAQCQVALDYLAEHGITTSICYGPCGNQGILFSVDVLTRDALSFDKPFGAISLEQAIFIAYTECVRRGWCPAVNNECLGLAAGDGPREVSNPHCTQDGGV